MKKIIAFLISLFVLLTFAFLGVFCVAANAETSGYFTYSVLGGEVTIERVNPSANGDVVIPSNLAGYPVVSIGDSAFGGCSDIISISIPASVKSIGSSAFAGCNYIERVYIFDLNVWCNINFENYIDNPLYSGADLFLNGTKVTDLVIPNDIKNINDYAFVGCNSIKSVQVPNNVKTIGYMAFFGCNNLESVTIGEGVTSIKDAAFFECAGLKNLYINSSCITNVGDAAFYGCTNVNSVYITNMDAWCNINFSYYTSNPLFTGNANLYINGNLVTKAAIPEGTNEIKPFIFYGCKSLKEIYIPSSVTFIGALSFDQTSIETVYFGGSKEEWNAIINAENILIDNAQKVYNSANIMATIISIEICNMPAVTEYYEGAQSINLDGCKIKIYYSNQTTKEISVLHDMVSGFDASKIGKQKIFINYDGFIVEFEVTIKEKEISAVALLAKPYKTVCIMGQTLDVSGGKLAVCYTDGTYKNVAITPEMVSGFDCNVLGLQVVYVYYKSYIVEFVVNVIPKPQVSFAVIRIENGIKTLDIYVNLNDVENYKNLKLEVNGETIDSYKTIGNDLVYSIDIYDNFLFKIKLNDSKNCYDEREYNLKSFNRTKDGCYIFVQDIKRGDANGDGNIDIKDLVRVKKIVAELAEDKGTADVSQNGSVTSSDLTSLARVLINSKKGIEALKVVFEDDEGNILQTMYIPKGFGVKPTIIPRKEGYVFNGWDQKLSNIIIDKIVTAKFSVA